jgi:hypothetical protein
MRGLSTPPEPPKNPPREPGENQFSLAQVFSLMFAICVLSSLFHFALNTNLRSSAPVWMALVGWLAAVAALCATRLIRLPSQFVLAGLIAALIAALAMTT